MTTTVHKFAHLSLRALLVVATTATVTLTGSTSHAEQVPETTTVSVVSPDLTLTTQRTQRVSRGEAVVRVAAAQAGDPYRYGASGPNAFDCSGLTSYAYRKAGKTIPRTSSAQRGATKRIAARDARRGDLVFFHGSSGVYHVGIYAGSGNIWHAPYTGARVRKEHIWTSSVSYGRVR